MELQTFCYDNPAPLEPRDSIRVVFWNVWYRADHRAVIERLRQLDADILVLQEVTVMHYSSLNASLPEAIAHKLNMQGVFAETRIFGRRPEIHEGSAIFSRIPITASQVIQLSSGNRALLKHGAANRRVYIEIEVGRSYGSLLRVGNVHLSYKGPGVDSAKLLDEHEKLLDYVERMSPVRNFIFGGDFNALPNANVIELLKVCSRMLPEDEREKSWVGPRFLQSHYSGRRLDYAFANIELQVSSAQFDQASPSDHRPLVVEIAF